MKVCCLLEVCNHQDMTQEISQLFCPGFHATVQWEMTNDDEVILARLPY